MVLTFNKANQKNIVYCVLNSLGTCINPLAKDIAINAMDFLIQGMIGKFYDIIIGDNEYELLLEASKNLNYTHAVIINTGTYAWGGDRLFFDIEKLCEQDFFIAGHILNRGEFYLELHQQFYVINLKEYIDLKCPSIDEGQWFVDNIHEEYAPIITAFVDDSKEIISSMSIGTTKKIYTSKLHGWNILKLALENNKKIIDIGNEIRTAKRYLYQEYDHVFLKAFSKIFHLQLFARNVVAPWNSDIVLNEIPFNGPVEQYITLGTGLNWIKNLSIIGYTKDTKIVFTDINHNCLRFMKELIENWDGVDYNNFYQQFQQFYPNGVPESVFKNLDVTKQFEEFKTYFDDWPNTWKDIQQLNYDFKLIDYMADYDLSWISLNKKTIINFSDMFNYSSFTPFQSVKFRIASENKLIENIKKINPDITVIFTSRAATGFIEFNDVKFVNKAQVGKVTDFKLTLIEDLKKLPWHDEWKNSGRKPLGI